MNMSKLSRFALGSTALALAQYSFAQSGQLEEIIVTAQKRTESLQDVPISIVAISGDLIVDRGISDLGELTAYIPNFQKSDNTLATTLVIRGISSGVNPGFEQSVVQYSDDIALGKAPLARMPFMDLQRVEVLRGPQNVLFGKNSIGGAISLITQDPTDELEGSIQMDYEPDYNTQQLIGILSGPISDSVRGRIALRGYKDDGYYENDNLGRDESESDQQTFRVKLAWDVNDNIETMLKVEHSSFDNKGNNAEVIEMFPYQGEAPALAGMNYADVIGLLGTLSGKNFGSEDGELNFHRNTNFKESRDTDVDNVTFSLNWSMENMDMTAVTGWVEYDERIASDSSLSGLELFETVADEGYTQFSQEIRFTSSADAGLDWIAGFFYQNSQIDQRVATTTYQGSLLTGFTPAVAAFLGDPALAALPLVADGQAWRKYGSESDVWAVFGQVTWEMSDTVRAIIGARYTEEDKDAQRSMDWINLQTGEFDPLQASIAAAVFGIDFKSLGELTGGPVHDLDEDTSDGAFTPSVALQWEYSESGMAYLSVATGSKASGFDAAGSRAGNFEYDDESVITYEAGLKSGLLSGSAEINLAVFYTDYTDLQVSQFDGNVGFFVGNAAEAVSQGVEIDGRWAITDSLTMRAAFAYLDFEFDDYASTCSAFEEPAPGEETCDFSGKRNLFTPEYSASVGFEYSRPITHAIDFRGGLDFNYRDEQFVDVAVTEQIKQDAHTKVNLRLGLESEHWSIAIIGKNLTDEEVVSYVTETPLASSFFETPSYYGYVERPRTYTLQAMYRY